MSNLQKIKFKITTLKTRKEKIERQIEVAREYPNLHPFFDYDEALTNIILIQQTLRFLEQQLNEG